MKRAIGILKFVVSVFATFLGAALVVALAPFDRRHFFFFAITRFCANFVLLINRVRVKTSGLENIKPNQGYVYVSNHASMFDIPAVIAGIPDQIRIVYKKELQWIPIFGWGLKFGSYIAVDRRRSVKAQRSLDEAIKKIRNGESVLLFAEGTRTLDGKLQPFKRGAFHIAARSEVPVVPLTINGSFRILPKHSISVNPGHVELILEAPIHLAGENGKEAELKLMGDVHAAIAQHYVNQ